MTNCGEKPELVAPAGDWEKLEVALSYGADAVYCAGQNFGLRANAKNFSDEELAKAVKFVHEKGKKMYVTVNVYPKDGDFDEIEGFLRFIEGIGVDAAIVSDLGVFDLAREVAPKLPLHVSTQANVINSRAARVWKKLGAERVICAREMSFGEIGRLSSSGVETELFCHGAMCVSYSGRCLLSAVMTGRSANNGECAQPCRYKYCIVEEKRAGEYFGIEEDKNGSYIMNSTDLRTIEFLPEIVETGASALKIEGRAKTVFYAAATVKAYREALDDFFENVEIYKGKIRYYWGLLELASHRPYSTGFYLGGRGSQEVDDSQYVKKCDFVAIVLGYDKIEQVATIEQRNWFATGEQLYVLSPLSGCFSVFFDKMYNVSGNLTETANHPKQILKVKILHELHKFDMFFRQNRGN